MTSQAPVPGLYRNWKGHMVYVQGVSTHSECKRPGVNYLHVTGSRTGLSEWMPLEHWLSRPLDTGPRRWTPCYSPCRVSFSPIDIALDVFRELHPASAVDIIWIDEHDTPGATYYPPGRPPLVALSSRLTVAETVFVLLHELAHAVTGHEPEEHGPEFDDVLATLTETYELQIQTLSKLPGFRLVTKGQEIYGTSQTHTAAP